MLVRPDRHCPSRRFLPHRSRTRAAGTPQRWRRLRRRDGALAVAPFVNISAEAADDWIGDRHRRDGVGRSRAARRGGRRRARSTAGRRDLGGGPRSSGGRGSGDAERVVREASRRLGAAWLVAGGYQRMGDRMRITARLVDTGTGAVAAGVKVDGAFERSVRSAGPGRAGARRGIRCGGERRRVFGRQREWQRQREWERLREAARSTARRSPGSDPRAPAWRVAARSFRDVPAGSTGLPPAGRDLGGGPGEPAGGRFRATRRIADASGAAAARRRQRQRGAGRQRPGREPPGRPPPGSPPPPAS